MIEIDDPCTGPLNVVQTEKPELSDGSSGMPELAGALLLTSLPDLSPSLSLE